MSGHGSNLLIAAAFDFAGHGWPEGLADRMAASLALGKGGRVVRHPAENAILLSRAAGRGGVARDAGPEITEHGAQVLFAGYLQDRAELRRHLDVLPGRALSDAALYGLAHARWGEDCDQHVIGHYAAILWFPEERRVRAVRSPVDPSPLHWWSEGARLILATTPRAIFAAGVPRRLDDDKLDSALIGQFSDPVRSWFSDISRLEGGTSMIWKGGSSTRQRFWSLESLPEIRLKRDEDYVDALDGLFAQATTEALEGFEKPGLLLSGGLDSSAVASFMLDVTGGDQPIACFTSVPAPGFTPVERVDSFPDERAHVEALAAMHPRLRVDFVDAAEQDFRHLLSEMFLLGSAMPLSALNLHWIHASLSRAAEAGCDVMLSGSNGNATFSYDGNTAFAWWLRRGSLPRLMRELGAIDQDRPLFRRFITWALMPNLPEVGRGWLERLARGRGGLNWSPLGKVYLQARGLLDQAAPALRGPARTSRQARAQLVAMALCEGGDIELALELLHGVPFRDPTVYRPLFEFCAGIPEDQYRRDGVSRWLARRVLAGRIPDAVRLERRIGQQAADWPLRLERARPAMTEELEELATSPQMAARFDVARIIAALRGWNGADARFSHAHENVALPSSRAIVASRFIRFANGSNT